MFGQKNLSSNFITKIIERAAGRVPENVLEDFLLITEAEISKHYFTNSSESNLLRIIQAQFDIASLINECLKYTHHIEILINISCNSNYLSDILVRDPEYFHWIINPSILNQEVGIKYYAKLLSESLSAFKTFESKVNALRFFKRKELLRIGLKDIYLKEDLPQITKYLSGLAIAISSTLFKLCYDEVLKKHKLEKINNRYVLVSLGKLGGGELNYSSDIDLIAFYDKNTFINKKIYFHQILLETILLFIDTASKKTGSGFLYRVDFRLRPDGRNAPLCGSFSDYLRYYEMRSEDWERQMLIKANYLCGSRSLYNKFWNYISRFVYPSSFTIPPTEQIRKLKLSIEKRRGSESNIKLAVGGIRDIEFSIQVLQILNGGKEISIHAGNSLHAIEKLETKKMITEKESKVLSESYIFFRRIEHYLQLMNDQQTHNIPAAGELAEKISHFLEFKDLKSFKKYLKSCKDSVQDIFNSIIGIHQSHPSASSLDKIIFNDKIRTQKNYDFLRTGKNLFEKKQFDLRTVNSFEKIEEELLRFLKQSIDPDLVLENFSRIIKSANFPQIWYEEFNDRKFFRLFLELCERSQKAIDLFAEDKILHDEFLARESLLPFQAIDLNKIELKTFFFRTAVQLVSNNILADSFGNLFAEYLTLKFTNIISSFIADKKWKDNFFIAGMGSFGAAELTFNSDIDLIFVLDSIDNYPNVQKDFQTLLQTFRNYFPGLEIDCRLRPEGKSSLLVWDIEDYKKYFNTRARVWELQAFTKCKFLAGNNILYDRFVAHYIKTIKLTDESLIKSDVLVMRKNLLPINSQSFNLKKSPGALLDIDFMVSYLLLTNSNLITKRKKPGIIESLNVLRNSLLNKVDVDLLDQYFRLLKSIELINQNTFNTKVSKIPTDEKRLEKLVMLCGFENGSSFIKNLNGISLKVKKEFQKVFD